MEDIKTKKNDGVKTVINQKGQEEMTFDLVVAGGGVAGLCVAIAAARKKINTAIIHDRPVFGGNSSSEVRVAPLGAASKNAWARETGILEELLIEERSRNHDDIHDGMANSHYDIVLYEAAMREPYLHMFLNTSVRAVEVERFSDGSSAKPLSRITSIRGSQLASEKEYIFRANQFVDCTGDATVGALAGADFHYGRESRNEYQEALAPEKADSQTMGSTLTMRARNIGRPVPYKPPSWIVVYKSLEEIGPHRSPNKFNRVDYGGYWWIEIGTPFHQIDDNQKIKEELLKHVLGVWNYIKNYSPDREVAANYALEWVGMVPGKRESRRLLGDVILTETDCHVDRCWPDQVCYAGWFIDLHIMGGILNKKEPAEGAHVDLNYAYWTRVAPFSIPLRALYSRNVVNLWMAGRNISVTHIALGATRVMMTHALQGQAVGTAAAYSIRRNLTPRQVANPAERHITLIQQELLRDDVRILGVPNQDPKDLARLAKATASSSATLDFGQLYSGQWTALNKPHAQVFPVTTDRIENIAFYLKNDNLQEVETVAELEEMELIWDQKKKKPVGRATFKIPSRFEGWVTANFNAKTNQGRPHRVWLPVLAGVSWASATKFPTGTTVQFFHASSGGCEPKNRANGLFQPAETTLPAYQHWIHGRGQYGTFAVRIEPTQKPYEAENINNGLAWPLAMPNIWISSPGQALPQAVTLDFGGKQSFTTVIISFDTHLNFTYHAMPAFWRPPACARDWQLSALVDGHWRIIFKETDNYQRRRTARFPRVSTTALKLEVLATNAQAGDIDNNTARVYEIRAYDQ